MQPQTSPFRLLLLSAICGAILTGCGGSSTTTPTAAPTTTPTAAPTTAPTAAPTTAPTAAPTTAPTAAPTTAPTAAPTAVPTASTPVSVVGRITAFGSIYVNGVRYEIDNATLNNTGPEGSKPLLESDLKIGMVVNLTGNRTGTSGTATRVSYNELLEAPITAINLNADGSGTIRPKTNVRVMRGNKNLFVTPMTNRV